MGLRRRTYGLRVESPNTKDREYALRLARIESRGWRRFVDVQAPYRRNIRGLDLGFTLDVGAGIGRNLLHLEGHGVGVDHNAEAVRRMRERGLRAFLPEEFQYSPYAKPASFDALLIAHVLEHLPAPEAKALLAHYLPFVRKGGKVAVITPQPAGYRSDATHVNFVDDRLASQWLVELGLTIRRRYSFPFPRWVGHVFSHNEFIVLAIK